MKFKQWVVQTIDNQSVQRDETRNFRTQEEAFAHAKDAARRGKLATVKVRSVTWGDWEQVDDWRRQ